MPVRTCRPSLYWARRMSWVPSEKMMFTEIRVRGSGPCLLPVLGARTHVHAASSPHQAQAKQALQSSLKCSPTAAENS